MQKHSMAERAMQFGAFDALKGFDGMIDEETRIPVHRRELSEDEAAHLSKKLAKLSKGQSVRITYYVRDNYTVISGTVTEIEGALSYLALGRIRIPFGDIVYVAETE
ncbi:MAG: YolD-like family protein [Clostridia bacterium]|nr:YolD-like family protein [Clostridia bacterium]